MICQQLSVLSHCAGRLLACDVRVESRSRPRPLECCGGHHCCQTAVVYAFVPGCSPPTLPWDGAHCIRKVAESTENLSSLSWQRQSWTESTSIQTLSSSVCGLNREISRKTLKVITLDKKGICSGSRAADTSTLSYFWGALVTELQWKFWTMVQYVYIVSSFMLDTWFWYIFIADLHYFEEKVLGSEMYCLLTQID